MIIFLDSDGTIVSAHYGNIGQGSSMDWIYAVAPIAATAYIDFELPNGDYVRNVYMSAISGKVISWAAKLTPEITKYSGTVKYTIRFTFASGDVLTSSEGSFTVSRGVPVLPSQPDSAQYSKIKSLFGNADLSGQISTNAKNIQALAEAISETSKSFSNLPEQISANSKNILQQSNKLVDLSERVTRLKANRPNSN